MIMTQLTIQPLPSVSGRETPHSALQGMLVGCPIVRTATIISKKWGASSASGVQHCLPYLDCPKRLAR